MMMSVRRNSSQVMMKVPQLPQDQIKLLQVPRGKLNHQYVLVIQLENVCLKVDVYLILRGRDVISALER